MPMTREQMDRKIDEHFGYEQRDDVAGVLATLTDDAEHDIVGFPTGPTHGREAARGFYVGLFSDLADGSVRSLRRLYGDPGQVTPQLVDLYMDMARREGNRAALGHRLAQLRTGPDPALLRKLEVPTRAPCGNCANSA